ncbi:MAG: hypothetical protein V1806_15935 [Pseudomonadota bacterium]
MEPLRCPSCLFCEELGPDHIRCSNADVAQDAGWEEAYLLQGYLDLPLTEDGQELCFWFVQKR